MAPPLVLVMLGIKDFEVDVDELDFVEGMLDETFEEEGELAIFDEELLLEEEETLPRVAVIELFVLEVLAAEVLAVAELFTVDDVFLLLVVDDLVDDFTEDEVVLTADDLVLDVLDAELRMHLQAFVTWDAERPGTGELVREASAHQLQKGVV